MILKIINSSKDPFPSIETKASAGDIMNDLETPCFLKLWKKHRHNFIELPADMVIQLINNFS